jgi:benzoate 4-monooxygenase
MTSNLVRWVNELDCISSQLTRNGFAEFNAMPWFSYLAFDIIGDLAFGAPFGMVVKGRNEIEVQLTPGAPISYAPAVEVLNRRGEVSSTLGLLPALRPYAGYLPDPFFTKGISAVKNLNGIAVAAVRSRIDAAEKGIEGNDDRNDILARLLQSKDANGDKMGRQEVTAEALTQLIAGSDTVSNTSCAIFYWILHGECAAPGTIIQRLQAELDAAIPPARRFHHTPLSNTFHTSNAALTKACACIPHQQLVSLVLSPKGLVLISTTSTSHLGLFSQYHRIPSTIWKKSGAKTSRSSNLIVGSS